jgi:hypothetical protein
MKARTHTKILPVPPDVSFDFLAEVEHLPDWAVNFCLSLERDGDEWWAETPGGRLLVRYATNPRTRVLDITTGPDPDHLMTWPARVVPLPDDACAFLFTVIQAPGVPDDVYAQQCDGLAAEMEVLERRLTSSPDLRTPE